MNYTSAPSSSVHQTPGHHRQATDHGYHEQKGGANGPNGHSRKDHGLLEHHKGKDHFLQAGQSTGYHQ